MPVLLFLIETLIISIVQLLIQTWLNNYFDSSDASVKNILQSLQTMKKLELEFPIMDLSSSIETVRAMSHQLNNVEQ